MNEEHFEYDQQHQLTMERDFQSLNLRNLQTEKERIGAKNQQLQSELSDLAFHNYRTYVDVGKTAEYCKEKFSEMDNYMRQLRAEFPTLLTNIDQFKNNSQQISTEFKVLDDVESTNCLIWEVLKLPNLMEKCIKAGHYEKAYAMTNFALTMKQTKLIHNPMFKNVVDYLLEARHSLLDELFNKFSGPLDLAKSIQIVNNIRKIPYMSNTQLRISILQYRDIYLEKKVHSIVSESEPDFILRVIELYRECMYDTIVLYLAVFPDAENKRKHVSMNDDPRWERWTGSSQNYLLQSWAQHNIDRLLTFVRRAENKTLVDMEPMISKLMSFAFSFGRIGLDFRPFVYHEFTQMITDGFQTKLDLATKNFTNLKRLDLIDGDIFENTRQELEEETAAQRDLSAPIELCIWDDLCVLGNSIIDALNETRDFLCVNFIRKMFAAILTSLQTIFGWLDAFIAESEEIAAVKKAAFLLIRHFVPFINRCFFHCFPYDQCARQYFRASNCSLEEYQNNFTFTNANLFSLCRHGKIFQEISNEIDREMERTAQNRKSMTIEESEENYKDRGGEETYGERSDEPNRAENTTLNEAGDGGDAQTNE